MLWAAAGAMGPIETLKAPSQNWNFGQKKNDIT